MSFSDLTAIGQAGLLQALCGIAEQLRHAGLNARRRHSTHSADIVLCAHAAEPSSKKSKTWDPVVSDRVALTLATPNDWLMIAVLNHTSRIECLLLIDSCPAEFERLLELILGLILLSRCRTDFQMVVFSCACREVLLDVGIRGKECSNASPEP